jgi:NifU-like protein involved in Fe-S cluster formation
MTDDDFVKLLEDLQKKIEYDEEETYSKVVIREYRNPSNFGFIKNPDASAKIKGPCGDTMRLDLKISNEIIFDVCFWTDGCGATIACGSMLTKMIKEKTLKNAENISSSKLLETLGGLPKEHHHCTTLAISTLQKAIKNYYKKNDFSV